MVLLVNNFEEGTSGTALTPANTAGAGQNAFDAVSAGTGTTLVFSSAFAAHGALSAKVATGSTAVAAYMEWSVALGAQTTHYGRVYVNLSAAPAANDAFIQFQTGSGSWAGGLQLTTSRQVAVQLTSFALLTTLTPVLTAGTWYRVEWQLNSSASGAGQITVNIYQGDSTTPVSGGTYTSPANITMGGASTDAVLIGWTGSHANQPAVYVDDVGLSTTGFLGPANLKMAALSDTFPGTALNTALWSPYGTVAIAEGIATLTDVADTASFSGFSSQGLYDLTGSHLTAMLVSPGTPEPNTAAILRAQSADGTNQLSLLYSNGNLVAQVWINGTLTQPGSVAYSAAAMAWLRIREASGTVYFEYAADFTSTWTTLASVADPFPVTALIALIQHGSGLATDPQTASQWGMVNPAAVIAGNGVSDTFQLGSYMLEVNEYNSTRALVVTSTGQSQPADFAIPLSALNITSGGPGAYPAVFYGNHWGTWSAGLTGLPLAVAAITGGGVVMSSCVFTTSGAAAGDMWDAAYDIWFNVSATGNQSGAVASNLELMVWASYSAGVSPAGVLVASGVTVAGHTWDVYYGAGRDGNCLTYKLTAAVTSLTGLDIGLFAADAVTRGYLSTSWYLIDVEFGFELWNGGASLAVDSFSVSVPVGQSPSGADSARGIEAARSFGGDRARAIESGPVPSVVQLRGDTSRAAEHGSATPVIVGGTPVSGYDLGRAREGAGVRQTAGASGVLGIKLGEQVGHGSVPPGLPGGAGGPAGPPPPYPGTGWEIKVLAAPDFYTLLAVIPSSVALTHQFVHMLKDLGSGTVTLNLDAPFWDSATLPNGQPAHYLLDYEHLWQVWQDGVCRFEFLGETVTETLADSSEQRIGTVTGPGTAATLKWGMAAPPGFPGAIRYKLDAISDSFSEVDEAGDLLLDTGLWNATANTSRLSINPSGSARLMGSPGVTVMGTTAYDATNTLASAQVSPIVSPDANGNQLNGSQVTQMYVQSLADSNYYALIGLSATTFYCQFRGPSGTYTQVIASATAYAAAMTGNQDYQYWQISEAGGQGGGSGTFYFWTSPDGQTWKQQWKIVHNWDARDCGLYFAAAYSVDNAEYATVTGINTNVTTSSLNGPAYYTEPIVGGVWLDLLAKAQARGTIPFITTGQLSSSTDSFGNPWTDSQSVQIANGTDLFTLLGAHTSMINADWVMQPGFRLQVGIPVTGKITLGTDRSATVVFRDGMDCMARVRTRTRNQVSNLLAVINTDGRTITATDSSSVAAYGQREAWLQAGMQITPADLDAVAAAADLENADEVLSWTLQVTPYMPGRTVFRDFAVGDWIGLERPDFSATDAVRVAAIAVQVATDGTETHELTLVSYIAWLQEQLTYIQTKLGGGFVNAAGTTAIAASITSQNAPTVFSLTLGALGDVTSGGPGGNAPLVYDPVTGQWVPAGSDNTITGSVGLSVGGSNGVVTIAGDGSSVTVSAPPAPPADAGAPVPPAANTVIDVFTTTITDATGTVRQIIGAQPDGTVTTRDLNGGAPAAPDSPVVNSGPQSLVVGWDGLLGGSAPLSDFLWAEVHVSTTSGFTPSSVTLEGTMVAGGHSIVVGNLVAGTTYYVRLLARNTSGIAGNPSPQVSGQPEASGAGTISTYAATAPADPHVGDVWYNTANGNQASQWNGTAWVQYLWGTGSIALGAITTPLLAAGAVSASNIAAGTITAGLLAAGIVVAGIVDGTSIAGAQFIAHGTTGQVLVYAGTPAAGNLDAVISGGSGSDGFGNSWGAGISSFGAGGAAAQISSGVVGLYSGLNVICEMAPEGFFLYSPSGGSGNLISALATAAGTDTFSNAYPQGLFSQQLTLQNQSAAPAAFAGGSVFYSSVAGRPRYRSSAGADDVLERSQVNVAQFTVGGTSASAISAPLTYQANEGNQSSEYEIEISGNGSGSSVGNTLLFQLFMDGANLGGGFTVGGTFFTASGGPNFTFTVRFTISLLGSGTGAGAVAASSGVCRLTGTNIQAGASSNSISVGGLAAGLPFDATAGHTFQVMASWGATASGQSLTTYRTKTARRM